MPITDELKSINRLERAGFTSEHAKAIVEVQETALQRGFDRFVEVLRHELGESEGRMRAEFRTLLTDMQVLRTDMANLRADVMRAQRDQMLRFAAIVSVVFAVLSLVSKFL